MRSFDSETQLLARNRVQNSQVGPSRMCRIFHGNVDVSTFICAITISAAPPDESFIDVLKQNYCLAGLFFVTK